jgi:hypothetical protein
MNVAAGGIIVVDIDGMGGATESWPSTRDDRVNGPS